MHAIGPWDPEGANWAAFWGAAAIIATPSCMRIAAVATALIILLRHRENIGRLRRGQEPKFRAA